MEKNNGGKKFIFGLKTCFLFLAMSLSLFFVILFVKVSRINPIPPIIAPYIPYIPGLPSGQNINDIKNFSSEQDFKNYLESASKLNGGFGGYSGMPLVTEMMPASDMMAKNAADGKGIGGGGMPERISGTNVQVIGIDEPDIVKTDGKEIYFSGIQRYYYGPMMRGGANSGISFEEQQRIMPDSKIIPPIYQPQEKTNIIKAFPPADLALDGKIDKQGDLLLDNNILVVFPSQGYYGGVKQEITAFDVSKPKSPEKKWTMKLENNASIVTSRLHDGKIYLITKNNIDQNRPCPINPLSVNDFSNLKEILTVSIPCTEIYHPVAPVPVDSTFVAMLIDPSDGKVEKTVSFVGSSGATVIYVSENAVYATYTYNESIAKFLIGFLRANKDLLPFSITQRLEKISSYDISENSKMNEFQEIMQRYKNSLNSDDSLKFENELRNKISNYYKNYKRDLEKTGIIKVDLDKFQITASGAVPGHLLNNFAMDEYQGNLRLATSIGQRFGSGWEMGGQIELTNDVYVLDKNLNISGSVKDFGNTEQIYSVRFIEDKGYVVTFRQTDPFYVLDLSNPKNPAMAGELKIPGYSSYLHPLDATHILGIGQEGSQVKISLFDVTDKNNPIELDKYLLDEYWTEVSNNYHAFLLDTKHNIFFLPGSKGGYAFSYKGIPKCTASEPPYCKDSYTIELKKAVSQNSVKRAIYLNDYLYIIGEDKITVLNESDWQKVNELNLQ